MTLEYVGFGLNIHAAPTGVRRHSYLGAPVTIEFGAGQEITIFCQSETLAADLAAAINGVLERHRQAPEERAEQLILAPVEAV